MSRNRHTPMLVVIREYKGIVALAIAVLLALVVLLTQSPPDEWSQAQRYGERLQAASWYELMLYVCVGILATSVGLPRQLFAFISGFAFGILPGVLLSLFMAICGCAIAFSFSRRFLRQWLVKRHSRLVEGLDSLTKHDAFWKVVMLRFQPLGTNLLTNLAAGVSEMPARLFLPASLVGYIPQMAVFALIGSGVRLGSSSQLAVSFALLVVSVVLGLWLLARSAARKSS